MNKNSKIITFYSPNQVPSDLDYNFSKSPQKPKLLIDYLIEKNLIDNFNIISDFKPFEHKDFLVAHTPSYVYGFFNGDTKKCGSNGLKWNEDFANSVKYTNSSLYNAIKYACENPRDITFSPTSGFHHATPKYGSGFCTFSGQVIASLKMYQQSKLAGCYIDLDGHFGNSIEDSRKYCVNLKNAIPENFNINPVGEHKNYLNDLDRNLVKLSKAIDNGDIHYVVFCHGADSHHWDDLRGQLNTEEWMLAAKKVYEMMINHPDTPLILSLFGGYRTDDYRSVLSLHTGNLVSCLNILSGHKLDYTLEIKESTKRSWEARKQRVSDKQSDINYLVDKYGMSVDEAELFI